MDFTKALCLTTRIINKRVILSQRANEKLQSDRVRGLVAERPVVIVVLVVRKLLASEWEKRVSCIEE